MDPLTTEVSKTLSDAQNVQQVLAVCVAVLLVAVVLLARQLWNEGKANKEELRGMYKEQIDIWKALKDDKHEGGH